MQNWHSALCTRKLYAGWAGLRVPLSPRAAMLSSCCTPSSTPALQPLQHADSLPFPALPLPPSQVLVIPTDEELSIAQQTLDVIRQAKGVAAAA